MSGWGEGPKSVVQVSRYVRPIVFLHLQNLELLKWPDHEPQLTSSTYGDPSQNTLKDRAHETMSLSRPVRLGTRRSG